MKKELRGEERFDEIGRIDCEQICALPGVLENISISGLSARFPNPVFVDSEGEYTVFITFSRPDYMRPLEFVCVPKWKTENESETEIGFKILRSPDSPALASFISSLQETTLENSDLSDMLISPEAEFVQ
ncbi:PilZ domain-containing protein [Treponema sp.]|uniref:PilZ domain-containing protein n=1 Tax=Treponema sp. TaxID=166 RepID=UPI003F0BCE89